MSCQQGQKSCDGAKWLQDREKSITSNHLALLQGRGSTRYSELVWPQGMRSSVASAPSAADGKADHDCAPRQPARAGTKLLRWDSAARGRIERRATPLAAASSHRR